MGGNDIKSIAISLLCLLNIHCIAKEDISSSYTINEDTTVTFNLKAINAQDVLINGSLINPKYEIKTPIATFGGKKSRKMNQVDNNKWQYVTQPLSSNLYTYRFIIDGQNRVDSLNKNIFRDVSDIYNFIIIGGGQGEYFMDKDVPHGIVKKVWYPSIMKGWKKRRMTIYVPPKYDKELDKRYPVLYLLHGSGGDEDSWQDVGRACQILDNMMAQGLIEPMIVVMPNGNVELDAAPGMGKDTNVEPSANNVKSMLGGMESTFVHDIVEYVDSNYRTIKKKEKRAIAGLSLGGLHTLYISLNNPELFNYIGLFSAQTTNAMIYDKYSIVDNFKKDIAGVASSLPFFNKNSAQNDNVDLEYLKIYEDTDKKLEELFFSNPKLFYIAYGKDDFVKKLNENLKKKLDKHNYEYYYYVSDGGHTWDNWRKYLIDYLPRLFKTQ